MCAHVYVRSRWKEWREGGQAPSCILADRGRGTDGTGKGPPVSHLEERQHRPLPQAQAFQGGNMPDHSALFLPGFVLHQHQGDISLQDSTDEPGHSELQGKEESEGQGVTVERKL